MAMLIQVHNRQLVGEGNAIALLHFSDDASYTRIAPPDYICHLPGPERHALEATIRAGLQQGEREGMAGRFVWHVSD
jgi:hypothetical protein